MSPSTMSSSIASLEDEKRNDFSRISDPTASSAERSSSSPLNPSHTGHAGEEAPRWIYRHSGKKRARTLVLCFDGTGDQFDDDNSNVVEFFSCLKKDNQEEQLVYYQAGIGTYTRSAFVTPITVKVSKVLDEMVAWNLCTHVQEGYEFLMQNYIPGDKVCIFGFSRGAYTARALAGMVQKVGLLPPYNTAQIPFAWAMYKREDERGLINSAEFKRTFSADVVIDFVGVWDTVTSVGITGKELPFTANNNAIRVFRHALALDEHRVKFLPNFYQDSPKTMPREAETAEPKERKETDALEVWFAGCHCDVGGGSVRNGTRHSLARIPLRWMIRECFRMETDIIFDRDMLESVGLDVSTLYPVFKDRPPRTKAPPGCRIGKPENQKSNFVEFLEVCGGLIAIPLTTTGRIVVFPVEHLWLLVKFTPYVKKLRRTGTWRKLCKLNPFTKDHTPAQAVLPESGTRVFKSEEEEDLGDVLSPSYDRLRLARLWWILEIVPYRFRLQKDQRDDYFVRLNLGQGRKIYGDAKKDGIKVHRSVKTRLEVMDGDKSAYKPRAWFRHDLDPDKKRKVVSGQDWNESEPDPRLWEWVD